MLLFLAQGLALALCDLGALPRSSGLVVVGGVVVKVVCEECEGEGEINIGPHPKGPTDEMGCRTDVFIPCDDCYCNGWVEIEDEDYDPSVHKKWEEE